VAWTVFRVETHEIILFVVFRLLNRSFLTLHGFLLFGAQKPLNRAGVDLIFEFLVRFVDRGEDEFPGLHSVCKGVLVDLRVQVFRELVAAVKCDLGLELLHMLPISS